MKPYPKFVQYYIDSDLHKVRLYNTDPDTGVGIYYNLLGNTQIDIAWSAIGLLTSSRDPNLDNLKCYEISKEEFYL